MPMIDVRPIADAAASLRKTLVQMRSKHPDSPKIGVHVTETEENKYGDSTSTSAKIVITIEADTQDIADRLAGPLVNIGCICTSSGETEVTCDCSAVL